jgi:hypothetical protein
VERAYGKRHGEGTAYMLKYRKVATSEAFEKSLEHLSLQLSQT